MTTTRAQREALLQLYRRDTGEAETYQAFRRRARRGHDCLMIHWKGMWIGIEKDGYTHS